MSDRILIRDSEMVACENKLPSFYFEYLLIKNRFLEDSMDSIDSSGDTGDIAGMTMITLIVCVTFGGVNRVPS